VDAPAEFIDVSAFQAPAGIDWPRVRGAGIAGVIAKATDGQGSPDAAFLRHVDGAHAAGLPCGAYHYARIRDGAQDCTAQAREFASRYRAGGCELLPALDFEPDGQPHVPAATWRTFVLDLANAVTQELSCRPLIYSFPAFWLSLAPDQAPELEMYRLWVATYAAAPATMPPWGGAWTLWQYTDHGAVAGIPGNVDRSRTRGGLVDLWRVPPASERSTTPELPPVA
jgi:GH25 family lysozyme M1 (1,4-beta-N-acetylmuramidase)